MFINLLLKPKNMTTITESFKINISKIWPRFFVVEQNGSNIRVASPFWIMVKKEVADHVKSWRFLILTIIIFLTCFGSLYTAFSNLQRLADPTNADNAFFFLRLFTASDGTLPPFFILIAFLGPLLGLTMGFDAINSEQNRGTLSRILAQPVPRDYVINAKFTASLIVIGSMVFALTLLVLGAGLIAIGIPPTADEFLRIIIFTIISIAYIAFWLNLAVFFSVRFKQPATSALSGIAVWLFFTIFYPMLVNMVLKFFQPSQFASEKAIGFYEKLQATLIQIIPGELYNQTVATLLTPSVRSIGPLTMEQMRGVIPGALPIGQSLLVVWPQLTGLLTLTLVCFILSYVFFMRREIRSRG